MTAPSAHVRAADFARIALADMDGERPAVTYVNGKRVDSYQQHPPVADDDPALPPFVFDVVVAEQGWDPVLERTRRELAGAVVIYSAGLVMCSACAPAGASRLQVEAAVNAKHPTGISSRWEVSDDEWRGTEPGLVGPIPCETDPNRTHWLLAC